MNTSNNQKARVTNENSKQLEELLSNKCCGQEMVLEKTSEADNNQVCLKYVCSKCKKTIFDLQKKVKEKVFLTIEQHRKILFHLGSIQEVLYEAEDN